jgi:DNA-binding transcriptional ArsR family regulator
MSLLPSRPDAEPADDAGPRVVGVDDDAADDVLSALSSGTARRVLAALHDDPAPPSELADHVDTSLQNVQYHLEKLQAAGAIEVVETGYSEKGREMDIYAPADQPLVVYAGDTDGESTLRTALSRLLGALALLAVGSALVQSVFGELSIGLGAGGADGGGAGGDGGGAEIAAEQADTPTPSGDMGAQDVATEAPTQTPAPEPTEVAAEAARQYDTAADAAAGLPPGLLFFAGGLFVLAVVATIWYVHRL